MFRASRNPTRKMIRDAIDAVSRLGEPPWYDGMRMPRFEKFTPAACDPRNGVVALLEIRCQGCDRSFVKATEIDAQEVDSPGFRLYDPNGEDAGDRAGSLHPGDPPLHDVWEGNPPQLRRCAMEFATAVPIRVLEFWRLDSRLSPPGWVRDPRQEVPFGPGPS